MKNLHRAFCTLSATFFLSHMWAMHPIDTLETFEVAPGCEYMAVRWLRTDDPNSGINSFILRVDATNPSVSFQERSGQNKLIGRERISSMARHLNAPIGTNPICIAAVNGDFFWMENEAQENGLVRGMTIRDSEYERVPEERRLMGGITEDKKGLVGTVGEWTGSATLHGKQLPLSRINYRRLQDELVLFNRYNDSTTCTDSSGTELLLKPLPNQQWHSNCVVQTTVVGVEKNKGSMLIPYRHVVLSGNGKMAKELNNAQIGDTITIETTFKLDGVTTNFSQCIGGDQYAQILKDGVVETENFWPGDHPRNAFGYTRSRDTLFFVIVDGRIPESPGCTTSELGEMMRQVGCYNATNWDGGRSAHLWIRGRGFMNKGCSARERAVSNGMFIFYKVEHNANHELDSLLQAEPSRAGGNYHGYDFYDRTFSPAPKGYEAFYLSHYGRHGSRSKKSNAQYIELRDWLLQAEKNNNLTAKGERLLAETQDLIEQYNNMAHRLTDRGRREHTLLAERMFKRNPEIFRRGSGQIRVISSQAQRCLVSMAAFTNQLARMDKNLHISMDCGSEIQKVISPASDDEIKICTRTRDSLSALLPDDTTEVFNRLFLRPNEMQRVCSALKLTNDVYETVVTAQCFDIKDNVYNYLPGTAVYNREIKMAWRLWIPFGNNDLQTQMRRPGVQVALNDIINKADEAIHNGTYCADLRFGHDTQMLSILSAIEVSGVGEKMKPEELEYKWYTFRELPMASNVQLIFYRPRKKDLIKCSDEDILVKILYNETERQIIGLQPAQDNYYRWSDLKKKMSEQNQ